MKRIFDVENKNHLTIACLLIFVSAISAGQALGQSTLTRGHEMLLTRGLQLKGFALPDYVATYGGTFSMDLWYASGFNTIDFCRRESYEHQVAQGGLPSGDDALPFAKKVNDSTEDVGTAEYIHNLVSVQFGDEQSIVASELPGIAAEVAALKARFPTAIIFTNQGVVCQYVPLTLEILDDYVQAVQPDMLHFTEYPFRFQGTGRPMDYVGGSPTNMYEHIELYRKAGLAGLDGTGSQPIPVGMFVQTYAHIDSPPESDNDRYPTESEFRLQQFVGWAAGMKSVDAFVYTSIEDHGVPSLNSMFFEGVDPASQTPTPEFYQYAELNRQSRNLGDALIRLISTDFRMKMGKHGTGSGVTNDLPDGVTAMNTTADPYLKSVTATNLGTKNNGLAGDVVVGFLKPLDASLVPGSSEDDVYFMIVNGLTDATDLAADCEQLIHLEFDFGASGIDNLLRLSRDTGLVEEVSLTYISGSQYSLDLYLDGGTGDLFKYNTGTTFVPEPATLGLLVVGVTALAVRRK